MTRKTTSTIYFLLAICFIGTALGTLSPTFRAGKLLTSKSEDVVLVTQAIFTAILCLWYSITYNKTILRVTTILIFVSSVSKAATNINGWAGTRGVAVWITMALLIVLVHKGERRDHISSS